MIKQINLAKYTSIGIGPIIDAQILETITGCSGHYILGRGNNILASNNPPPIAVLSDVFDYIRLDGNKLTVGAATSSGKLLTFCKKNNIAGFELLAKLPGNMGGLVAMNAGLKEWEIFENLHSITTNNGIFTKDALEYGYRHTNIDGIIFEIVFDIHYGFNPKMMEFFIALRNNQPSQKSAGSCFKNPPNHPAAGKLIQDVGLKGFVVGGMSFSEQHANFLVNLGGGTFEEAMTLIQLAQKKVLEHFNIKLELEIIVL